ncbi:MAG: IS110 family transposase [Saprospiraceae bacterium]|nr:IS110 family transposase [Saprospiraceae bacterium]
MCFLNGTVIQNIQIDNDLKSLRCFVKRASSFSNDLALDVDPADPIFIMEFTGIYNNLLLEVLHNQSKTCYVVNAVEIKNSLGLTRGKNDIVDAQRIAEYAYRFHDKLSIWAPLEANILKLNGLRTHRSQLIKVRKQLTQGAQDNKKFLGSDVFKVIDKSNSKIEKILNEQIDAVDEKILETIKADLKLKTNYDLLTSVPGIGPITASALICVTKNFTRFDSAKKLSCYCGVVPFEKSSGNKIGKPHLSHAANKDLKALLHLGAGSILNSKHFLGQYYRRLVADGKHKSLARNNLKNKMLTTAFACVKKQIPFQIDYQYSA